MRTKIGAKPTLANECPELGPLQTCRRGGSDGKSLANSGRGTSASPLAAFSGFPGGYVIGIVLGSRGSQIVVDDVPRYLTFGA